MRLSGPVALLSAVGLAACDVPRPASPALWTVADVMALYGAGAVPTDAIAVGAGLPGGVPLGRIVSPEGVLYPHPALADNYEITYLTTEVWAHFDELWLQPLYVPVTGWQTGPRMPVKGHWVFSVGPDSRFYSPFWQVIYVDLPDDAAVETLHSVRDVLDSGYPLEPGPGRTVALVPSSPAITLPPSPSMPPPPGPTIPVPGTGLLDGQQVSYLDFGGATFTWNGDAVIDETPLYVPVYRTAAGALKPLGVTTIAAPGPPHSNLFAPPMVDNQPRYAAYWRLYLVVIPPPNPNAMGTAPNVTVFAPPGGTGLYEQLQADGFPVVDYSDTIKAALAADSNAFATYEGRVSLKPWGANGRPDCFDDPTLFPASQVKASCGWLGSQFDIENTFPDAIIRTDVTVTCPVIHVDTTDLTPVGLR